MSDSVVAQRTFARLLRRSVLVPIVTMVLLAAGLIIQVQRLMGAARMVEHTDEVITRLYEYQLLLVNMQAGVRGFVLNGEDLFLKPYIDAQAKLPEAASDLRQLVSDREAALKRLVAIDALRVEWTKTAETRIAARREDPTTRPTTSGVGNQLMEEIRTNFADFISEETRLDRKSVV